MIGAIAAAAMPRAARSAISSPVVVTASDGEAHRAEDGQPDEQHPAPPEAVGQPIRR